MEMVDRIDRPNFLSLTNTWILCAILLVFATLYGFSFERSSMNSMDTGGATAVGTVDSGGGTIIKVQNTLMYLLSAACILPFIRAVWGRVRSNALIFSVVGWAILSMLWSAMPSTTGINALRMTLNLVLVVYLFERYSSNEIQKLVMLTGCVAAASSLVLIVAFPQYGLQERGQALGAWEGIFGQKNLCGLAMILMLLPAFFVKLNGSYAKIIRVGYIVTLLVIIAMTRSAGGWVVCALCLGFITLLKLTTRMPRKDAAALLITLAGAGAIIGIAVLANFETLMYALGKDPTMTGRTVLWAGLLHIGMIHPFRGFGYMAFWQGLLGPTRSLAMQMDWLDLAGAESGVLELWLELGLVGLLLYLAIFLRAVSDALYCMGRGATPAAQWYMSLLFYVVATNIEGGALLTPSYLTSILPFVAFVGLRRESQRMRERRIA